MFHKLRSKINFGEIINIISTKRYYFEIERDPANLLGQLRMASQTLKTGATGKVLKNIYILESSGDAGKPIKNH